MSKQINIVSVSKSVSGQNNVQVTLIDGSRMERVLNLSPLAQEGLIKALLAAAPFSTPEQDAKSQKNFLVARQSRVFDGPNNTIGIEFLLSPGIAIHIVLEGLLPEALENQLHQFRNEQPSQPH